MKFQCPRGLCGDFSPHSLSPGSRKHYTTAPSFNAREGFVVISPRCSTSSATKRMLQSFNAREGFVVISPWLVPVDAALAGVPGVSMPARALW